MNKILGNFREDILADYKLFTLELYVHAISLARRKQTRYLSVAFMTDYIANLFPTQEDDIQTFERQLKIKSAATYITNELLENCIKFHDSLVKYPIKISSCLQKKTLILIATNCVNQDNLKKMEAFIYELLTSDVNEFYFRQLEKGAEENSDQSQLGFLSLTNDYSAKLGWKIETINQNPEVKTVTTMVQLTI
ncbi:slr1658 superfamily regulator [Coleofasciculus sp. G2-EDA-02]|uniref:slr1658 superfamily regulator n=1 Tax=Coleofasciculus sp. G2-EDA-02 TaxID=3069529 RepID=UPI0032F7EA4F